VVIFGGGVFFLSGTVGIFGKNWGLRKDIGGRKLYMWGRKGGA